MTRWFRFYDAVLDDPKVQRLSDAAFRAWVNLMCVASRNHGLISAVFEDISFALRVTPGKARDLIQILQSAGLIDPTEEGWEPHNWKNRQYESDSPAERMRRHRANKKGNALRPPLRNSDVVEQIQNRTETETDKKEEAPAVAVVPIPKPELPDWLDQEAWAGFLEMRKRIRAPMTARAQNLAITQLKQLANQGHDPTEILNRSTQNSWKGLFEPKVERNGQRSSHETFARAAYLAAGDD